MPQSDSSSHSIRAAVAVMGVALLLAMIAPGCARGGSRLAGEGGPLAAEQEAFWAALHSHCGQAYEGRITQDTTGNPAFAAGPLIMHVRQCEAQRILIPFHVGEDRSRTWIISRTESGLRLKHDHRHADGSEDEITQYGGDTRIAGAAHLQEFFADGHTASLIAAAATNVWSVEIIPGRMFAYALRREGTDRRFRVEFDLTRPVSPPPPPWGHE